MQTWTSRLNQLRRVRSDHQANGARLRVVLLWWTRSLTSLSSVLQNELSRCALVQVRILPRRWDRVLMRISSKQFSTTSTLVVKTVPNLSAAARERPGMDSTKAISFVRPSSTTSHLTCESHAKRSLDQCCLCCELRILKRRWK